MMESRNEKELRKRISMRERKLEDANYMLECIIDGREYIRDLCENILCIMD